MITLFMAITIGIASTAMAFILGEILDVHKDKEEE